MLDEKRAVVLLLDVIAVLVDNPHAICVQHGKVWRKKYDSYKGRSNMHLDNKCSHPGAGKVIDWHPRSRREAVRLCCVSTTNSPSLFAHIIHSSKTHSSEDLGLMTTVCFVERSCSLPRLRRSSYGFCLH